MRVGLPRGKWRIAAGMAVAGVALSACGTNQLGAAAITGNDRITSATLTNEVANLTAAYKSNLAKGIKPQRPVGQAAQQVLSWLVLFKIYDQLAAQRHINVTPGQVDKQLAALSTTASSSKVTLPEYVSAAGALPPDLLPELGRYFAILSELESRIDGGKAPTTAAGQSTVASQVNHAQCVAAKSLAINVNPQYGQFDYSTYSVIPAPPTLAAAPGPTPSSSPPVLKPPC